MFIKLTEQLIPGDKLAKPIYTEAGRILLNSDVELTGGVIKRLMDLNIRQVYVADARTDDIQVEDSVSDETRLRATRVTYDAFSKMIQAKKWNHSISISKLGTQFRQAFEEILQDLRDQKDLILQLSSIYSSNRHLYTHSVNVGIYSAVLGMALGLNRNQLIDLGIGAMLHDVGKTQLPQEILDKPEKLTAEEYKIIQEHTTIGYDLLRNQPDIPLLSAHCALQHHERIDGSGYPRKLKGSEIHQFGKIVGLADSYAALIADRSYRKGYLPHEALEIVFTSTEQFEMDMMVMFRNLLVIYPVGTVVKLSTGDKGVVVDVNAKHPHRPIVRVMANERDEKVTPYEVDLSSQLWIMITECNTTL